MQTRPGRPYPLGATLTERGVNFVLFSAHADAVTLCLFDDQQQPQAQLPLRPTPGGLWCIEVANLAEGQYYGYRVHGPTAPHLGHRFAPHKLLLDPYAKALSGPMPSPDSEPAPQLDNGHWMPKCRVTAPLATADSRPRIPLSDTLILELHPKGFSINLPGLAPQHRGKLSALAQPQAIEYFHRLGITTLELLPIHPFASEPFLTQRSLSNYWGYNSLQFFAIHPGYLNGNDPAEFAEVVQRLHDAGLEVIMDVVFNHSAEGDEQGSTYSFRGLDNASYYRLDDRDPSRYLNFSGCGNSLNLSHPRVLQMVTDSLRYWVRDIGIDGFRFDLATALGREAPHFDAGAGLLDAIGQDPLLSQVKLIAEPWDLGPDGYQLGQFPPPWSEWNDQYRDTVRRFWRGDANQLPALANALHGSARWFDHHGRGPVASINFITSHDGYTLADLVSYEQRHNHANGEHNRDGHGHNFSRNHGTEGPTAASDIRALRRRQQKNLLATLLLSQGVPMLLAGDDLGNSQQGNNNAYCQDNAIGWLDWSPAPEQQHLGQFLRQLIALRRSQPLLRQCRYQHNHGDVRFHWYTEQGHKMQESHWHQPQRRHLMVQIQSTNDALLMMFNAGETPVTFQLPPPRYAQTWHCRVHTQADGLEDGHALSHNTVTLSEHSLAVLQASLKDQ
ncbi:glycogen debranching protein GlgX [Ferrimonas kyonanensis]|uniref:glycogen debranching protein GlgX n=1 Tax=Ferrimonas kyonanensis TaxID=364763 RepID=UPI00040DBB87|nr:glycogen debranching protein GlgX [Ferrimonas kyonanensis]